MIAAHACTHARLPQGRLAECIDRLLQHGRERALGFQKHESHRSVYRIGEAADSTYQMASSTTAMA